jgi:hypothetical protein
MQLFIQHIGVDAQLADIGHAVVRESARLADKAGRALRKLHGVLAPRIAIAWASVREFTEKVSASEEVHFAAPKPILEAALLTGEAQWERATEILYLAHGSAEAAVHFQAEANEQFEAALYGLQGILEDLDGIMALPFATAPATATVHTLEIAHDEAPQPVRERERGMGAKAAA